MRRGTRGRARVCCAAEVLCCSCEGRTAVVFSSRSWFGFCLAAAVGWQRLFSPYEAMTKMDGSVQERKGQGDDGGGCLVGLRDRTIL